jgi:hypothetical protein
MYLTNGIVFDPFALHFVGYDRKISNYEKQLLGDKIDPATYIGKELHNEARFKRAFINACHYAETMTVVGPMCNLVWDRNFPGYIDQSLRWPVDVTRPGNEWLRNIEKALTDNGIETCNFVNPQKADIKHLNIISDLSLYKYAPTLESGDDVWLQQLSMGGDYRLRKQHFHNVHHEHNAPMLGLMGVIFTFKKPTGHWGVSELTNLGHFPPVVFFIPVLVPSRPVNDHAILEPFISSYSLSIPTEVFSSSWDERRITPFGSPYYMASVDPHGKSADTMRSLSDVFNALWSQATLYSAWNLGIDDVMSGDSPLGCLYLEPMGAGRRIRGYNRYKSYHKFDRFNAASLKMDESGVFQGTEFVNMGTSSSAMYMSGAARHQWQVGRKASITKSYQNTMGSIFVLPSYFGGDVFKDFSPLIINILGALQHRPDTMLSSFIYGPNDPMTALVNELHGEDTSNPYARLLNRIPATIEYNEDGNPKVLMCQTSPTHDEALSRVMMGTPTPSKADYQDVYQNVAVSENFAFMDAFCANSPKDLSQAFKEVKKESTSTRGRKKKELVEQDQVINLFEDGPVLL